MNLDSLRAGFGAAGGWPLSSVGHDFLKMFTLLLNCEFMKQFGDGNRGHKQSSEAHVKI